MYFSRRPATVYMTERSAAIIGSMPGRFTLTATLLPSNSSAKWTCAIEAEATGVVSNDLNFEHKAQAPRVAQTPSLLRYKDPLDGRHKGRKNPQLPGDVAEAVPYEGND